MDSESAGQTLVNTLMTTVSPGPKIAPRVTLRVEKRD